MIEILLVVFGQGNRITLILGSCSRYVIVSGLALILSFGHPCPQVWGKEDTAVRFSRYQQGVPAQKGYYLTIECIRLFAQNWEKRLVMRATTYQYVMPESNTIALRFWVAEVCLRNRIG